MKLKDVVEAMKTPDDVDYKEASEMEVEFCSISKDNMNLLSVYEHEDKIIIEIGTDEDNEEHTKAVLG